jgi:putative ABC transport system permease protein
VDSTLLAVGPTLAAAVVVLAALAALVVWRARLASWSVMVTAASRAALQLAVVSALIAALAAYGLLAGAFVLLMYAVASRTAARRVTRDRCGWWLAAPIAAAVGPVVLALLGTGVLPTRALAVIPVSGILLGGAMTATALAGRRATDELRDRHGEVEAALSLGLLPREARLLVLRDAAALALVPALDQTRTVGLVTLPGAFVGMLLGGASPLDAGAVQLFVLVGILAVQAVAVAGTVELVARGTVPVDATAGRQL